MLEHAICHYCGSKNYRILHEETRRIRSKEPCKVVKCTQCGLMYLNPRPGRNESETIYNEDYYKDYLEKSNFVGGTEEISPFLVRRLDKLEILKPSKGVLLEIGSGFGYFLHHAQARGWKTKGVEVSKWAAENSRRRFRLDIHHGTLEQAKLPSNSCDVIHLNHVLEHLHYPLETLKKLEKILKKDGLVVIEVPHEFGDLYCRLLDLVSGRLEPYAVPSPHLYFFTPKTLSHMLEKAGFRIVALKTYRSDKDFGTKNVLAVAIKHVIFKFEKILNQGSMIEVFAMKRGTEEICNATIN